MTTLICGSLAFDSIMSFEGRFSDQILPNQLHILNVSFLVPELRRDFGGCAGNIAYSLKLLGGHPLPMATVGPDGQAYVSRLRGLGIDTSLIREIPGSYTAQAMIMTDRDNNQITAFHPGAMTYANQQTVPRRGDVALGIVSPDGRSAMIEHAQQMADAGIRFVFDPGQGLPMFDGAELRTFVEQASWVTVNDYEGKVLCERTGWTLDEIARRVEGLVVTLGGQGCQMWSEGCGPVHLPAEKPTAIVDPTGCGDAWRGAFLYGLERGWPVEACARLGNRLGAIKIASAGPQNYQLPADFLQGQHGIPSL